MGVSVVKSGPYFSSGSISFSQLRTNFTDDQPGFGLQISASQLRRNTDVTRENPIVPDATENEGISTGSNLSLSQFRNSVKRYVATQTGTDDNAGDSNRPGFRMGRLQSDGTGIDWSGGGVNGRDGSSGPGNGNQIKNVQKGILITGTCGSNHSGQPAAAMTGVLHNVRVDVSGSILGYGGKGGGQAGSSDPSGQDGGTALKFGNLGNNNRVIVGSGARIWAGGGGGERGKTGANGANGTCVESSRTQGCGGKPSCPSGFTEIGQWNGRCCQSTSYCCGFFNCGCERCVQNLQGRYCERRTTLNGGLGGIGGKGGNGRGYNNQSGSTSGESGLPGQNSASTCGGTQSPPPQRGQNGERGGDGGNYGASGQSTLNTGNGGQNGRAITSDSGRSDVYGTVNSNTVKGSIY